MEGKKFMWMLKKDLLSLWRHKPRLVSMFLFPIIMIVLFGYGMGGTIENVPIAIVDQSHGEMADQTLMAVKNMSLFEVKNITSNVNLAKEMVNNGEVKAAIILPPNYDDIRTDQSKMVVLYLDSSDQIASQAIVPATQGLFSQLSAQIGAEKLASLEVQNTAMNPQSSSSNGSGVANTTDNSTADNSAADSSGADSSISSNVNGIVNSINLQINRIYGDIAYIDFLVPAVLAMTVMMSCMMGMGQSIAGERETGELARLFMTPTSITTVVGGKIFSKLIIEIAKALILLAAAILLFGITINGNIFLAIGVLILGALTFVGFGIMISATTQTQEDYTQIVMPFTMPMMFVSGVFYPIETMPWIFQKIAYLFPLTYLNDAMRGVMIKGAGIGDIWIDLLVLLGFLVFFFVAGVIRFDRDV
ncbi:ABC transporter permease [Methanobrevibacter arboriphilus]|jgi:ABC-2 type transport system permease protein|uniref:ABC transporter permease n=1 Tax=Methanobrevibacter arboriphilus TaxID=39441 RepID=A0ACA8R3C7_METAZ|nr:ABC transporter permease [Methanobrevibacter arboriphilus]MCC7561296.1 ABC transporter permease [Methanobrevibacter arboriphilus]BBL62097.1 ABC transporter permease [Methanobrevibacter arboriphilus]GLI11871.1 ABC transporter permease [Methanobrevibacter arboriphilus]